MPAHTGAATHATVFTAAALAQEILAIADTLRAAQPDAIPTAFWDFDGTLIEGDCADGLRRGDGANFAGLIEMAIAAGYSAHFSGENGVANYRLAVRKVSQTEGSIAANAFIARMFAGAPAAAMRTLAHQHFGEIMGPWIFADALEIWRTLEAAGIRNFVISASPDFFVKGAAATLGVPDDRLHGVRLPEDSAGHYLDEVLGLVTFGEGKAARMREILAALAAAEPQHTFWPIAGFGNSIVTDGPLLHTIAHTPLPAAHPLSVLVNEPPTHLFLRPATFRPRTFTAVE
jgi:phosphoserine phosphatase